MSALGEGFPAFSDVEPAASAPTVDLYLDYQCPACASFEAALGRTINDLAQQGTSSWSTT